MHETHRSHCLQKCTVTCLGIPSEMSTWVRRQATHMLAGLGAMGTPQVQQRLEGRDAKVNETHINDGLFQTLLLMIYIYIIGFSLFTKDSMYNGRFYKAGRSLCCRVFPIFFSSPEHFLKINSHDVHFTWWHNSSQWFWQNYTYSAP